MVSNQYSDRYLIISVSFVRVHSCFFAHCSVHFFFQIKEIITKVHHKRVTRVHISNQGCQVPKYYNQKTLTKVTVEKTTLGTIVVELAVLVVIKVDEASVISKGEEDDKESKISILLPSASKTLDDILLEICDK